MEKSSLESRVALIVMKEGNDDCEMTHMCLRPGSEEKQAYYRIRKSYSYSLLWSATMLKKFIATGWVTEGERECRVSF